MMDIFDSFLKWQAIINELRVGRSPRLTEKKDKPGITIIHRPGIIKAGERAGEPERLLLHNLMHQTPSWEIISLIGKGALRAARITPACR
jgi:hypothetical protein